MRKVADRGPANARDSRADFTWPDAMHGILASTFSSGSDMPGLGIVTPGLLH
jgi:hypothetical protein